MEVIPILRTEIDGAHVKNSKRKRAACVLRECIVDMETTGHSRVYNDNCRCVMTRCSDG